MFLICGTIAVVLYDIFLITDYVTLNDRFTEMVIARLGIFTPSLIVMMIVANRFRSTHVRELLASAAGVPCVILPMTVMVFSQSPDRLSYQYGSLLAIMFSSIIQRLRFNYAALSLAARRCWSCCRARRFTRRARADDIRRALRAAAIPHPALGPGRIVTASFGVAGVVAPESPLSILIEAADTALYAAKRAGRDCIWPPRGAPATVDEAPRLTAAAV